MIKIAINLEQEVEISIGTINVRHYRICGYNVNIGDKASVKARHLPRNVITKIIYTCDICNKEFSVGYGIYNRHQGEIDNCNDCASKTKRADKLRIPYEEIYRRFKDEGCELITKEYTGCKQKLKYVASCGHENEITATAFQEGFGRNCKSCSGKHRSYDVINKYYEDNGCTLLSTEYKRSDKKLLYIAQCGHENNIEYRIFQSGQGRKCPKCAMPSGEDHFNYKPWLTEEDREYVRNIPGYQIWRSDVYVRDKYTCQCCGKVGGSIRAHHIEDYSHNPKLRIDIDNGITFCESCHDDFHTIYGKYKGNTRSQLNEYLKINQENFKEAI